MLSEHTRSAQQAHQRNAQKITLSSQVLLRSITVLFCFVWVFFFFFGFFHYFFKIYNAGILQVPICPDFYYLLFYNLVNIMRDRDQFDN